MKIVGAAANEVFGIKALDLLGLNHEDVFASLQAAGDLEEGLLGDDEAELFEKFGADDGVADAGFVLEADEDHTFRGAGTLAADDVARDADDLAVASAGDIDGAPGVWQA